MRSQAAPGIPARHAPCSSPPVWTRLIFLIAAPYIAVLPVLLWPRREVVIEHLPARDSVHPCEGTWGSVRIDRRPAGPDPPPVQEVRRGWRRVESAGLAIESNVPAAEIRSLARMLETIVPALEETFGLQARRPLRLRMFQTREEFRARTGSRSASIWIIEEDWIVLPRVTTSQALAQILHWHVHRTLPRAPPWLEEGLAELASRARLNETAISFEAPAVEGRLEWPQVPGLSPIEARTNAGRLRAASLLHFLLHRHGPWALRHLVRGGPPENLPGWNALAEEEARVRSFYR